mgnify:CR=1 FL=1
MKFRKEFDSIGSINVPNDKYWGASTQRSKKYFDIGDFLVRPILIKSIAIIKKAAAIVHFKEKQLPKNGSYPYLYKAGEPGYEDQVEKRQVKDHIAEIVMDMKDNTKDKD